MFGRFSTFISSLHFIRFSIYCSCSAESFHYVHHGFMSSVDGSGSADGLKFLQTFLGTYQKVRGSTFSPHDGIPNLHLLPKKETVQSCQDSF